MQHRSRNADEPFLDRDPGWHMAVEARGVARHVAHDDGCEQCLGGSDCLMDEFPTKPRGMHNRTYQRFEALAADADERWSNAIINLVGRTRRRVR